MYSNAEILRVKIVCDILSHKTIRLPHHRIISQNINQQWSIQGRFFNTRTLKCLSPEIVRGENKEIKLGREKKKLKEKNWYNLFTLAYLEAKSFFCLPLANASPF